jgi:hypothetical protein
MNKSCFNYTKIKNDCKQEIAGHLSTREKRKKRKKIEPYEMAAAIVLKVHIQS